ncbi:uncharacterized protein Bfra_002608 [Botrytis fragariae]|uniref:Uncharacterized protein n=1 Tax=Botrytis fragariae TaxID=1964551 RepID=A0A8H6AYM2_9HELO|nr:uncharacterized protein Bfra_002608 [Botrytis fragariae]KAF5876206.1 hypothetical protein Bfra_002608 [Botrytis fragariae]
MRQGLTAKNDIVCTQSFSGPFNGGERGKKQKVEGDGKNVEEEGYNKKERKGRDEGVGGNGLGRLESSGRGRRVEGFITQVSSLKATHTTRFHERTKIPTHDAKDRVDKIGQRGESE